MGSARVYQANKEAARELVLRKLVQHNAHYHLVWGRVAIRNTRSRWGSCSKKGNLNFNYRIVLLPEHLQDYLVVHELCHLRHFNHSKHFWSLVAEAVPKYAQCRAELARWRPQKK